MKFVIHPVSKEQKEKFGCRIVDARFAGNGDKIYKADGKPLKKEKEKESSDS